MNENLINLKNRLLSDNYDSLLQIVKQLNQLMEKSKEKDTIKILKEIIDRLDIIINENKKNFDILTKDINELSNKSVQSIINIYTYKF